MKDFMTSLNDDMNDPVAANRVFLNIWIIHFTEENPIQEFGTWACKSVTIGGPSVEIKNKVVHEKLWTIYHHMCRIGNEISQVAAKGSSQITAAIKQKTQEWIPAGEELDSLEGDKLMKVQDYVSFYIDNPDIKMEKEMLWPVDPDLIY